MLLKESRRILRLIQASQDEDSKKSRNEPGNQPQETRDPQTFIG